MKKRIFVAIILIILFTTITVVLSIGNKPKDTEVGSEMAIMVQNETGEGYYEWTNETWPPSSDYQLNTTKSVCNGTENVENYITYSSNNISINNTSKNLKCTLYFDRQAQCFTAGTKVLGENGYVNIEDIKVGDLVWSVSEKTGEKELKPVSNTIINETTEIYKIKVGNVTIEATPRHRFYVMDKGWVRAYDLEEGDYLVSGDNKERQEITEIVHKTNLNNTKVYNLEVEDNHNYLISSDEILVHNGGSDGGGVGPGNQGSAVAPNPGGSTVVV